MNSTTYQPRLLRILAIILIGIGLVSLFRASMFVLELYYKSSVVGDTPAGTLADFTLRGLSFVTGSVGLWMGRSWGWKITMFGLIYHIIHLGVQFAYIENRLSTFVGNAWLEEMRVNAIKQFMIYFVMTVYLIGSRTALEYLRMQKHAIGRIFALLLVIAMTSWIVTIHLDQVLQAIRDSIRFSD
jgi:hypothetical protein